jgi:hypothetical protein
VITNSVDDFGYDTVDFSITTPPVPGAEKAVVNVFLAAFALFTDPNRRTFADPLWA